MSETSADIDEASSFIANCDDLDWAVEMAERICSDGEWAVVDLITMGLAARGRTTPNPGHGIALWGGPGNSFNSEANTRMPTGEPATIFGSVLADASVKVHHDRF